MVWVKLQKIELSEEKQNSITHTGEKSVRYIIYIYDRRYKIHKLYNYI